MRSPLPALLLAGCSTLHAARPLEPGEHAVGLTVGGPLVDLGAPIPVPNAVVESQHGLTRIADRPLDLRVGLNAAGLPFGLLQGHVGAAWLLVEERGARPALTLADRLFAAVNAPGTPNRPDPELNLWAADQVELTASWSRGDHLVYTSLAQVFDLRDPGLLLCPAVGGEVGLGPRWSLRPEVRWYGAGQLPPATPFRWATPRGALGVSVGVAVDLGSPR
jgi:hypothetical protein